MPTRGGMGEGVGFSIVFARARLGRSDAYCVFIQFLQHVVASKRYSQEYSEKKKEKARPRVRTGPDIRPEYNSDDLNIPQRGCSSESAKLVAVVSQPRSIGSDTDLVVAHVRDLLAVRPHFPIGRVHVQTTFLTLLIRRPKLAMLILICPSRFERMPPSLAKATRARSATSASARAM